MGAEFPRSDLLQRIALVLFFTVWLLDSFVLQLTSFLAAFVPFSVRIFFAAVSISFALFFLVLSHEMVYGKARDSSRVLDTGVYGRVRHPMYLGTLLFYVGFITATFSILTFAVWIGIVLLYDKLASYEEEELTRLFGDAYRDYRNRVPKWLPRVTSHHE